MLSSFLDFHVNAIQDDISDTPGPFSVIFRVLHQNFELNKKLYFILKKIILLVYKEPDP